MPSLAVERILIPEWPERRKRKLNSAEFMLNIQKSSQLASLIFQELIPVHLTERTSVTPRSSSAHHLTGVSVIKAYLTINADVSLGDLLYISLPPARL